MTAAEIISLIKLILELAPDVLAVIQKILDPSQPTGNELPPSVHAALSEAIKKKDDTCG